MDALVELPGVGRKTANVVLGHALGVPGPAGRSPRAARRQPHRHRRIRRSRGRRAAAVRGAAAARWTRTSDTLILHGRRICKPKPLCDQCAVRDDCDYYHAVVVAEREPTAPRRKREASRRAVGTRDAFERLVAEALRVDPAALPRGDAEHRDRRRGRAVARAAARDGDRAARYAARPLPGHAAHRARAGTTATRCPTAS